MRKYSRCKYTLEERLQIIKEYETSSLSGTEVARKYGLNSRNVIAMWRYRLQDSKKGSIFASGNDTKVVGDNPMAEKTKAQLEAELAQVKKDLEWAKLQNKALNTLIDIAEEQGLQIRKKSGAKQ